MCAGHSVSDDEGFDVVMASAEERGVGRNELSSPVIQPPDDDLRLMSPFSLVLLLLPPPLLLLLLLLFALLGLLDEIPPLAKGEDEVEGRAFDV